MGSIVAKLHDSIEGVSEVFGYILILGIVMAALGVITVMATGPLQESQNSAQFNSVEQAFSVADSRLSKAMYSASTFQEIPFKLNDGKMYVNGSESDSYIEIYGPDKQLICRTALGTVTCVTKDGDIAYQDGGVWAKYPDGGTIMISPPNFDYNGVTLTLPIMQIAGNGTSAYSNSDVVLDANSTGQPIVIYPGTKGGNPVPQGSTVNLSIKSDYYQAWAQYINERTRATAETNPAKKIVNISLTTGWGRQSGLASSGYNTIGMDTSDPVPVEIFDMNLVLRNTGNDYTITFGVPSDDKHDTPDPQLLITAQRTTGHDNKEYAHVQYKYINGSQVEVFDAMLEFERKSDDAVGLNLLDHSSKMTYDSSSSGPSITWGTDLKAYDTGVVEGYDDSSDVSEGAQKSVYDVTEHYLWLMATQYPDSGPIYDVIGKDKYDGASSTFILQYKANQDIKYLFITKSTLNVTLGSKSG
jgi:hypothetical protein